VRLGSFLAVIAVHAIVTTQAPSNVVASGVLMLLQFGREVFFALTGFVLVYSASHEQPDARRFWARRVPFILVPYLTWTVVYETYAIWAYGPRGWATIGTDLLSGTAEYHLYFLLVTLQLYLVFPWLLRFVRRTAGHPFAVLAGVGALNVAWFAALQYGTAPHGWAAFFWVHGYELLPTYAVYVLAGCYAAVHLDAIDRVVTKSARKLLGLSAAAGALAVLAYVAQLAIRAPRDAAAVLQPAMMLSSAAAGVALYVAGRRWAEGRRIGERVIAEASDISFGVYLAHPLVLSVLLDHGIGPGAPAVPAAAAVVVAFAGSAAGAVALSVVARRTPLSMLLTGRPRRRAAERTRSASPVAVPVLAGMRT